jgi:hypothetical protein
MMEPTLATILAVLKQLSDDFRELREGVFKAVQIAEIDPEMALTRCRKVLEFVVRDTYQRRCDEDPGTRPLENLLQRLVRDGHFPPKLDASNAWGGWTRRSPTCFWRRSTPPTPMKWTTSRTTLPACSQCGASVTA